MIYIKNARAKGAYISYQDEVFYRVGPFLLLGLAEDSFCHPTCELEGGE